MRLTQHDSTRLWLTFSFLDAVCWFSLQTFICLRLSFALIVALLWASRHWVTRFYVCGVMMCFCRSGVKSTDSHYDLYLWRVSMSRQAFASLRCSWFIVRCLTRLAHARLICRYFVCQKERHARISSYVFALAWLDCYQTHLAFWVKSETFLHLPHCLSHAANPSSVTSRAEIASCAWSWFCRSEAATSRWSFCSVWKLYLLVRRTAYCCFTLAVH